MQIIKIGRNSGNSWTSPVLYLWCLPCSWGWLMSFGAKDQLSGIDVEQKWSGDVQCWGKLYYFLELPHLPCWSGSCYLLISETWDKPRLRNSSSYARNPFFMYFTDALLHFSQYLITICCLCENWICKPYVKRASFPGQLYW